MGDVQAGSRWFRVAFGKPRLWNGVTWIVFSVAWLAVTVSGGGNGWGYLLATLYALLGAVMLAITVRDLRSGRGAYTRRVDDSDQ
jgi:4-hydroxybenzoate polyprenyltransferase